MIDAGFELLAERFHPILDVFAECDVKFALEVHPTEIAFDIHTRPTGAGGAGQPPGVRLQFRSQPLDLAGHRSGQVHPQVPRSDLPRPHEGRDGDARRQQRDTGQPLEFRRSAPRLGFPLAGPGRREFRGHHSRLERHRLQRPPVGRVGRQRHGAGTGRREACEYVRRLDFEPSRVAFDAAFDKAAQTGA